MFPSSTLDRPQPVVGRSQFELERRILGPFLRKLGVKLEGRFQEILAERLESRDREQLALGHLREVLIDGRPGLAEVGFGPLPFRFGFGGVFPGEITLLVGELALLRLAIPRGFRVIPRRFGVIPCLFCVATGLLLRI